MRYPRQQAEVVALIDQMIGGISEHSGLFPHCNAAALQAARDEFEQASNTLTDAESQMALAAERKLEKFNKLQQEMKNQIKLGVVDTVDNPTELSLIGWGTKRPPTPLEIPAQPIDLKIIAQGDGMVCLVWNKLKDGGPIRCYTIERRSINLDWTLVANALNNEAKLTNQPTGCKLEYRVKAMNSSGESMPSNTVGVVL
jgi:hypothetical protein